MPDVTGQHLDSDVLSCIELCSDCHKACLQTVVYCLQQGGPHAEANHVRLMLDCAEICQTSANFMLRGSDMHGHTCGTCAEVCRRCAEDCERFEDDPRMAACAEECRRCAESCERMAAQHAGAGMTETATATRAARGAGTARADGGGARSNERGMSSRTKEDQTWKPTTPETPAKARSTPSRAAKSQSSSRRGSSRSS